MVTASVTRRARAALLEQAVHRSPPLSAEGLRERAFTLAFRDLVYPQIWEDPRVDLEALDLRSDSRMVTIASGGCNVLSYLIADPLHITAVDLNAAHVALNRLKLCAVRRFGEHRSFHRFFGDAGSPANVVAYDSLLRRHLDPGARAYWDGRDLLGRRRITRFARGFYRYGLLGRFIAGCHLAARLLGADPRALLEAKSRPEQREVFERLLAPLLDHRLVRRILDSPAALYGLGIPPAQYRALAGDGPGGMAAVLKRRLERLACGFDLADNYFAWQAFGRGYPAAGGPLPPYLEARHFETIKARAGRVDVQWISITEYLRTQPPASLDRYVLLDAQDWMADADLTRLWSQITRTAAAGARVIFRTAAEADLLPGRVPAAILGQWRYEAERSRALARLDRSAIYGGFHLYLLKDVRP